MDGNGDNDKEEARLRLSLKRNPKGLELKLAEVGFTAVLHPVPANQE